MSRMTTQAAPRSIYAHVGPAAMEAQTRSARQARRRRAAKRRTQAVAGPAIRSDRLTPLRELLRTYRETEVEPTEDGTPLSRYIAMLDAEVAVLEAWATSRTNAEQTNGNTVRTALEWLRAFGRMTVLDFSSIPDEERKDLVTLLALEHRWCYAAAGTTRDSFKLAIGRTGAR